MIYDIQALKSVYREYSNINQKVMIETEKGNLTRVKRGLYSDNLIKDFLIVANIACNPSYISFEYALSFYGLIPEYVSTCTSACFNKKNNKTYITKDRIFEYRSVPNDVFSYGIIFLKNEKGVRYKIASKEKALCDTLYSKKPIRTITDLRVLLFDDLRVDEEEFNKLDFDFIRSIAKYYRSNTLLILDKYLKERI